MDNINSFHDEVSIFFVESLERERDDLRETVGVEKQLRRHHIAELEDSLVEMRNDQTIQLEQYLEQIQDLQTQYESAQKKLRLNQNFIDVSFF